MSTSTRTAGGIAAVAEEYARARQAEAAAVEPTPAAEPAPTDRPHPHPLKPAREIPGIRVINGVQYTKRTKRCPVTMTNVEVIEWEEVSPRTGQPTGTSETTRLSFQARWDQGLPPGPWAPIIVEDAEDGARSRARRTSDKDILWAAMADLKLSEATVGRVLELLRLDVESPAPIAGRFGTGRVIVLGTALAQLRVFPRDVAPYLVRHTAGDFGAIGRLADVELGDDQRFHPRLFGRLVENALAIESGNGIVQSRYSVFADDTPPTHRERHPYLRPDDEICVATLLRDGKAAETAVTSSRVPFAFP